MMCLAIKEIVIILNMPQDVGIKRENLKDQFYTNKKTASRCVKHIFDNIPNASEYKWIEPSAGKGVFLDCLDSNNKCIGLDIDPKAPFILKENFITWKPPVSENCIVFGNPPFGRQSSMAKQFIRKSCTFADVIAFILPKSFIKPSMNNCFDEMFHNVFTDLIEPNSFEVNGEPYDVPCVFQIWVKKNTQRKQIKNLKPINFRYVKPGEDYHIAFIRVGGRAGKCYLKDDTKTFNKETHHFILFDFTNVGKIENIVKKINNHTFPTDNTVGPKSLSKNEINEVINYYT
jgi:hypothetical protein